MSEQSRHLHEVAAELLDSPVLWAFLEGKPLAPELRDLLGEVARSGIARVSVTGRVFLDVERRQA